LSPLRRIYLLGFPLDFVKTGVYSFDCDQTAFDLLKRIKKSCLDEVSTFGFDDCLRIKQLIIPFLLNLPRDIWNYGKIDQRVFNSMQYITKHISDKMTNEELAASSNMAANSFARLFKLNTGVSVQQYILKARIEKSCTLMHHTNSSFSFQKKEELDALNEKVQDWESLMWKYQERLPWANPGEKWVLMKRIFSLKEQTKNSTDSGIARLGHY